MTIQFTRWSWASWLLKGLGQRWLYHTAHHRLFLRGLGNSVKSHLKIGYPTSDGSSAHHHFTIFFLPWIPFWTKQKAKPPANRLAQSKNLKRFAVQRRHTHTHLDMYIYIYNIQWCVFMITYARVSCIVYVGYHTDTSTNVGRPMCLQLKDWKLSWILPTSLQQIKALAGQVRQTFPPCCSGQSQSAVAFDP